MSKCECRTKSKMFLCDSERDAVRQVCKLGGLWGYGNLISRLRAEWALHLIGAYGLPVASACLAARMSKDDIPRGTNRQQIAALRAYAGHTKETK